MTQLLCIVFVLQKHEFVSRRGQLHNTTADSSSPGVIIRFYFFSSFFFFFAEAVELSRLEGCQRSIRFARRMVKGFGLCVSLIRIAYSLLLGRVSI